MAVCMAFLRVPDIIETIKWYERIGFKCTGIHQEPGCAADWARINYEDAVFMLYPEGRVAGEKDAGLYIVLDTIDGIAEIIQTHTKRVELNETDFGMKEVVFWDLNNFQVTFGSKL